VEQKVMEDMQDMSQEDGQAPDAMESMGLSEGSAQDGAEDQASAAKESDPYSVKKRLGMQEKRHKKELRALQEQMMQMQAQMAPQQQQASYEQPMDQSYGHPDDTIQRAVRMALQAKDDQERQAKDSEKVAHVHRQYQALQDKLDNASDKYDDFDDVVRHPNVPYTEAMRDAALIIDNPEDVLYKLGKNPEELSRISKLHPLDQAREMYKLSVALMNGGSKASSVPPAQLGQIKSNPVANSNAITDRTPVSELRRRMKAGWK
jgi:hypothetical protein